MFNNVLVGVDGSTNGRDAIALARQLVDADGGLTLAHIRDGQLHPATRSPPECSMRSAKPPRSWLEAERDADGVSAELVSIVAYNPARGLHEQAEEMDADLLVVGSCGRGTLGRVMVGDDARAALNGAPCAVAIASAGYAEKAKPLARIGVAYNQSSEAEAALSTARELAAATGASVKARQVIVLPTTVGFVGVVFAGESLESKLEQATARLKTLIDVPAEVVYGLTGEELAEFGDELDLLVVGSRGYGPLKRLVLGSTSSYLQRRGRCSLLVLPRRTTSPDEQPAEGAAEGQAAGAATV